MMALKLGLAALTLSLFSVVTAAPLDSVVTSTTTNVDRSVKIIGGDAAAEAEFPFMVGILVWGSFQCGGVLINPTTVLTAAHCVYIEQASWLDIRIGSNYRGEGGSVIGVSSFKTHREYHEAYMYNDIALITLETPVEQNGTNVVYAKLPSQSNDLLAGSAVTAVGWGRTTAGGSGSESLNKVTVGVVDRQVCADKYSPSGYTITDSMVCAGDVDGKGVCNGDSGGPILDTEGFVQGLTSWGFDCARAEYPAVYTRVGSFIDWITENIV